MSKALILGFGFAAGALGAVVATLLLEGAAPAASPGGEAPPGDARLEELVERVDLLARRVRMLEQVPALPPAPSPRRGPEPAPSSPEAAAEAPVTPEVLEAKVREVMAKSREEERRVRGRFFAARAVERERSMLDRLQEDFGLTGFQRDEMEKLFAKRREAVGAYHRVLFSPRAGEDQQALAELRTRAETVRGETEEAMKSLLSPDQYEALRKEEERGGFGRMGMGGRGSTGR